MKRMIAIDGHSLLYRAFYALPGFVTKTGIHTGAVYGFHLMLDKVLSEYNPDYIFVAFDSDKPTFRHKQYKEYKAQRPPMPEELVGQIDLTKELLDLLGIPHIAIDGIEADDLIGTISKIALKNQMEYLILTGDKDSLQLVNDNCHVLLTKKGISEIRFYDSLTVREDFSITPKQVADYKGLVGDPSDNIPGVKGIGDKTATKLLSEFESIESILGNPDKLSKSVAKRLKGQEEIALLSKELATIKTELDLDIDLEMAKVKEPEIEPLRDFYQKLEFNTFLKKLPGKDRSIPTPQEVQKIQLKRLEKLEDAPLNEEEVVYLEEVDNIYLLSGPTWYLTLPKNNQNLFANETVDIKEVVSGKEVFTHGAKELYLLETGLTIEDDIEIAGYLLDPDYSHKFNDLVKKYLGFTPNDSLEQRAALAWQIREVMKKELENKGLMYLYKEIELPLAKVLAKMELNGIKVDENELSRLSEDFSKRMEELEAKIFALAGEEFNVNSSKQLGEILFNKLGLPATKKTKTGYSTSAEVLEKLSPIHPLPNLVIEYRQLQKLKSTYSDALQDMINPNTGRIHTSFNQLVTATGRLSSSNPNLQNIPVRTDEGAKIRRCFIPEEGYLLLSADYSQIELRILAHVAKDPDLIETFKRGEDIHRRTAAEVLGIPIERVTEEQRSSAKAVNFGIIYGISGYGLSQSTNLTRKEAEDYIEKYLNRYPKVKEYMDNIVKKARKQGYITTLLGRRRYLPDINSGNYVKRSLSERMALNTPIQGTAADIIKIAMINVDKELTKENFHARMLLQVHDELVFEVPEDELEETSRLVKKVLSEAYELETNLIAQLQVGKNWLEMKKV
ncbi:MAG TPA: DNA polymerase I [Firmicutes bacterium]|jgi:DNA polymerase-1|nr:DNA polymerase I [Bacillota bacterium]